MIKVSKTWTIIVELATGETIRAFTWTRDLNSGIARAKREAKEFGYTNVVKIWGI